ncbi:hypothetical protein [Kribbella italica]|uniref:Uncharacterized protein n=1 Tax=Kribbella italica TaxID=1540520 RepID=A0A7W9JAG5_9ACTN|nr:hypothetical protein [Kribbella italica]MBB5838582.1 hypothetical protein [Kribbella italica]
MTQTPHRTRLAAVLTRRRPAPKQEAANGPAGETRPEVALVEEPAERHQLPSYSLIGW